MMKPKILLAGYGSWAKADTNPAQAIALEMNARHWDACEVIGLEMPVATEALAEEIGRLLDLHAPAAWIGIGVSPAPVVQAEMVGINWRDFDVPDVTGATMARTQIVEGGPAAYDATLPNAEIVAAIRSAGVPAALSFHAGTHLCNQMLYTAARLIEMRGLSTLNGFIHVPQTPENILLEQGRNIRKPSMSLQMSSEALARTIEATARALRERAQPSA
ncbi:pyroglutamyl-peptidase I [Falsirhodobacter algicola]|uniref:Pyrrolidone-carboxylate peptidase n=1 Tax=Falsirhodobacter algicola TaxID=2692330 RepID=A0A8J8MSN1_9RHOB|nr:pyroglutamyl-peptidase I [Falsirhodobacter algicola]QUS35661.1 hypothetical protein GR316_04870 [Falsirhodobacter algicola]